MIDILTGQKVIATRGYGNLEKGKEYLVCGVRNNFISIEINGEKRYYNSSNFEKVEDNVMRNDILNVVNKWGVINHQYEIGVLESDIARIKRNQKNYRDELKSLYSREKDLMKRVIELERRTEETKDHSNDINAILNHDLVEKIEAIGDTLYVYTDYITIYDEDGNKFAGNKYRIEFDYRNMWCRIYGLDEDYSRVSWWRHRRGDGANDPHPHVNGESGEACWGSAGDMLVHTMNDYELHASFIIVLNFLQQVNTSDSAGEFIRNWECIDDDGDVIDNPYSYEIYCTVCEEGLSQDEATYCERCENYACEEHTRWIESEQRYVCDDCYDEHYSTCDRCGDIHEKEDLIRCEECNEYFCSDCSEILGDENYCRGCFENVAVYCDGCEENVKSDDTFYCDHCNKTFCIDCNLKNEYNDETLCEGCYEDALKDEEENEE